MITRTLKTEESYRRIAQRLLQACGSDLGCHPSELTAAMMAGWMIRHRTKWASATWRQYRAALDFVTGPQLSEILSRSELPPPAPRGARTSGLKEKRLPPDDLQKLLDHLLDGLKRRPRRSPYGISPKGMAALLLLCGTITGLRPCEWASVIVTPHPTGMTLRIRNAKNTNGRSHGEFREIQLAGLSAPLRGFIQLLVHVAKQAAASGTSETLVASAAKALQRTTRRLWPRRRKRYTLYSSRHQAAANLKTVLDKLDIAAIMGHGSLETASSHYGRRIAGRSRLLPNLPTIIASPSETSVAAVRAWADHQPRAECGPESLASGASQPQSP